MTVCCKISQKNWNLPQTVHRSRLDHRFPSHMDSPNFWHLIKKLVTVLYRNHVIPDQKGLAAYETPNHSISPILTLILK